MRAFLSFCVLLFTLSGWAASASFAWDASPSPDVTGYRIYWGPSTRTYTNHVVIGNFLTGSVTNLSEGATYYFAATAYNAHGLESDFSNEVSLTVPLPRPQGPSDLRVVAWLEKRLNGQSVGFLAKLVAVFSVGKQVQDVPSVAAADVLVSQRT